MQTILAGYDGTRFAEHALARVVDLARAFGSRVVVVSVATPHPVPSVGAFGLAPYYDPASEELSARASEEVWQQHRGRVEALFAAAGLTVEFVEARGDPAGEIVDLAEERRADLIVVGTHEPGFVDRLLGGSVSQGIARRAHCDVLIVHPPEGGDDAPSAPSPAT